MDEFLLCDDLGINVVAIEHHAGINSLLGANPLLLGILARQTRKVRILSLGTLVSLRQEPVRIAEEYATADVISRGRLEIGFVKSGGSEMASNNVNPQIMDFYDEVGGFDHLVMIGRSGFITHAEAEKGLKLFAKEVLPRLQEVAPITVE